MRKLGKGNRGRSLERRSEERIYKRTEQLSAEFKKVELWEEWEKFKVNVKKTRKVTKSRIRKGKDKNWKKLSWDWKNGKSDRLKYIATRKEYRKLYKRKEERNPKGICEKYGSIKTEREALKFVNKMREEKRRHMW